MSDRLVVSKHRIDTATLINITRIGHYYFLHDDESDPESPPGSRYLRLGLVKRLLDVAGAATLLTLLAPFLGLAALGILLADGGPVLYRHRRIGRGGRAFDCLKFRTMYRDAGPMLEALLAADPQARRDWTVYRKLARDPRVLPRVGHLLRRTSLDEIPQLLNVLRGEMSLVGPRPVVEEELPGYGPAMAHYLAVRPGLSGRWQVSGRNRLSFERRAEIDRAYVERASLGTDLWILALTPVAVLTGRGAG